MLEINNAFTILGAYERTVLMFSGVSFREIAAICLLIVGLPLPLEGGSFLAIKVFNFGKINYDIAEMFIDGPSWWRGNA